MAGIAPSARFRFLFRQDAGTIDRRTWVFGAAALIVAWLVLFLAESAVDRTHDLAKIGVTGLFVIGTMLLAACYYYLSAKRFRDRRRPASLALLLPAAGLAAAALNVMQPAAGGTFPLWFAIVADTALAGIVVWNVVELGILAERRP